MPFINTESLLLKLDPTMVSSVLKVALVGLIDVITGLFSVGGIFVEPCVSFLHPDKNIMQIDSKRPMVLRDMILIMNWKKFCFAEVTYVFIYT
jgi:hypothetical protein